MTNNDDSEARNQARDLSDKVWRLTENVPEDEKDALLTSLAKQLSIYEGFEAVEKLVLEVHRVSLLLDSAFEALEQSGDAKEG